MNDKPRHPKLDRNIVLERFSASVATGLFSTLPAERLFLEDLDANKVGLARVIVDIGEALTDEFMRRIGQ